MDGKLWSAGVRISEAPLRLIIHACERFRKYGGVVRFLPTVYLTNKIKVTEKWKR